MLSDSPAQPYVRCKSLAPVLAAGSISNNLTRSAKMDSETVVAEFPAQNAPVRGLVGLNDLPGSAKMDSETVVAEFPAQNAPVRGLVGLNDLPGSNVHHPNLIASDRAATIAQSLNEEFFSGKLQPRHKHKIYNREGIARRDMVWLGEPHVDDGMLPLYRMMPNPNGDRQPNPCTTSHIEGDRASPVSSVMPLWLVELMGEVQEALSLTHRLNHIVLHRYLLDDDNIGAHHDKYTDMVPGSSIVCLSFGETRTFAIHEPQDGSLTGYEQLTRTQHFCTCLHISHASYHTLILRAFSTRVLRNSVGKCASTASGPIVARGNVSEGDAVCMSYDFNIQYKHALLPRRKRDRLQNCGARFSITARSIATHFDLDRRVFRVWGDATLRSFS